MARADSKRKRINLTSTTDPNNSTTTTQIITTMPLRSRASASTEPTPAAASEAIDMAIVEALADPSDSSDSSDNEAPEAISLSTSKAQSRAKEATQAKAIKEAEARARKKRKERQEKLDEQAKDRETKRRRKEEEDAVIAAENASSSEDEETDKDLEDADEDVQMTDGYLPASLLADLPDVRPPTPPPEEDEEEEKTRDPSKKFTKKGVVILPSSTGQKDLQLGSMSVSILEKRNGRLPPPKVHTKGNSVRENWLRGRNSIAGAVKVKTKRVKVRSGRVQRKPFGVKRGFF
jgi:U3 small nucleolar RNA-associated protein 16